MASSTDADPPMPGTNPQSLWEDTKKWLKAVRKHCRDHEHLLQVLNLTQKDLEDWMTGRNAPMPMTTHIRLRIKKFYDEHPLVVKPTADTPAGAASSSPAVMAGAHMCRPDVEGANKRARVRVDDSPYAPGRGIIAAGTEFDTSHSWVNAMPHPVDGDAFHRVAVSRDSETHTMDNSVHEYVTGLFMAVFPTLYFHPDPQQTSHGNMVRCWEKVQSKFGLDIQEMVLTFRRDTYVGQQMFTQFLKETGNLEAHVQAPILAFHGTSVESALQICENGVCTDFKGVRKAYGHGPYGYWARSLEMTLDYGLQKRLALENLPAAQKGSLTSTAKKSAIIVAAIKTGNLVPWNQGNFDQSVAQPARNVYGNRPHTREGGPYSSYVMPQTQASQVDPQAVFVLGDLTKYEFTFDNLISMVNNTHTFLRGTACFSKEANYYEASRTGVLRFLDSAFKNRLLTAGDKCQLQQALDGVGPLPPSKAGAAAAGTAAAGVGPMRTTATTAAAKTTPGHHPYSKPASAPAAPAPRPQEHQLWRWILPLYGSNYLDVQLQVSKRQHGKVGWLSAVSIGAYDCFKGSLVTQLGTASTQRAKSRQPGGKDIAARDYMILYFNQLTERQKQVRQAYNTPFYPKLEEHAGVLRELGWENRIIHIGLDKQFSDLKFHLKDVLRFCAKVGFPRFSGFPELVKLLNTKMPTDRCNFNGLNFPPDYVETWRKFQKWQADEQWLNTVSLQRPTQATDGELQRLINLVITLMGMENRYDCWIEFGVSAARQLGVMTEAEAKDGWGDLGDLHKMAHIDFAKREHLQTHMLCVDTQYWVRQLIRIYDPSAENAFLPRTLWQTRIEHHAQIFGGSLTGVYQVLFGICGPPTDRQVFFQTIQNVRRHVFDFLQHCQRQGGDITKFWSEASSIPGSGRSDCLVEAWNNDVLRQCLMTYKLANGSAAVAGGAGAGAAANFERSASKQPKM